MSNLAQLTALVAGAGAAVYILGFVGLFWSIYKKITGDASETLYATSLIPKTVVAGQGVRLFLGFPLVATLTFTLVGLLVAVLRHSIEFIFPPFAEELFQLRGRPETAGFLIAGVIMFFLLAFVWIPRFWNDVFHIFLFRMPPGGWRLALWVLAGWGLILYATPYFWTGVNTPSGAILPVITDWRALLTYLLILFMGAFFAGLAEAFSQSPRLQLPTVRITGEIRTNTGRLLGHSDGFWHFFDENGVLKSVADAKTHTVRVSQAAENGE